MVGRPTGGEPDFAESFRLLEGYIGQAALEHAYRSRDILSSARKAEYGLNRRLPGITARDFLSIVPFGDYSSAQGADKT